MIDRNIIKEKILVLKEVSSDLNGLYYDEILKVEDMIHENKYKVAIIGEFSSGKSTFLNAISGKRVLYSSPKEATGVVTFLENSSKRSATIFFENGKYESVELSNEEAYEDLKRYLDIKNTESKVVNVGIEYPLSNIDKEVVFIDTPGLQGISRKQMEITRDILKEANATIMLITKKGFSKTELDLLTGRNIDFGKINTKEIFVVINKIGEISGGKTEGESLDKIQAVIDSVKEKLKENNLEHIKVFALDSRDYLWSKDTSLYKSIEKNNIDEVNTLLSQTDYEKRSRFPEFKEYLFDFLEEGNRNIKFLEDINNKINILREAFTEILSNNNDDKVQERDKFLLQLDLQKKLLIDNRRKLYNTLARYISNSLDEFIRAISEDIAEIKKNRNKEIANSVQETFTSFKSLNQDNVNDCRDFIKGFIEKDCLTFQEKLNEYQDVIYYSLVQKKFNDEFMSIFNIKSSLKFTAKIDKININLKFNNVKLEENSILDEIKIELNDISKKIEIINKNIINLKKEEPEYMLKALEEEKARAKRDMERKKTRLGARPEPEKKYKWETKTRRKFFFFKEEYEEKVPDGLDYTRCYEWDKDSQEILNEYLNVIDNIESKQEYYIEITGNIKKNNETIQDYNKKIFELKDEERKIKESIERRRKKSEQLFLEGKKEEIYLSLEKFKDKSFENLLDQIKDKVQYMNKQIKEKVKHGMNDYMDEYSKYIENKKNEILENSESDWNSSRKTLEKLNKLREIL